MIKMKYELGLAKTDIEKEEIYKLRYSIYIEEMDRNTKADHENKKVYDKYDETARIIYLRDSIEDKIVGTVRSNFLRDGPFECLSDYSLELFPELGPYNISSTSKLMVLESYRRTSAALDLAAYIYKYGTERGITHDFINVNSHLLNFYLKMGYKTYKDNFIHPEYGEVIPLVNDLSNSVLAQLAKKI